MSDFDTFSDDARLTFRRAEEHARSRGQTYLGTEHLLLGLLDEPESAAHMVLRALEVDPARVRTSVEFTIASESTPVVGQIRFTPRTVTVIDNTIDEANRFRHHPIGPEHILLGLLAEREGIAAGTLEGFGVTLDIARIEVVRFRERSAGTAPLELSLEQLAAAEHYREELIALINQTRWSPERAQRVIALLETMIQRDNGKLN